MDYLYFTQTPVENLAKKGPGAKLMIFFQKSAYTRLVSLTTKNNKAVGNNGTISKFL